MINIPSALTAFSLKTFSLSKGRRWKAIRLFFLLPFTYLKGKGNSSISRGNESLQSYFHRKDAEDAEDISFFSDLN